MPDTIASPPPRRYAALRFYRYVLIVLGVAIIGFGLFVTFSGLVFSAFTGDLFEFPPGDRRFGFSVIGGFLSVVFVLAPTLVTGLLFLAGADLIKVAIDIADHTATAAAASEETRTLTRKLAAGLPEAVTGPRDVAGLGDGEADVGTDGQ